MITRTSLTNMALISIHVAMLEAARNSKAWSQASGWPVKGTSYVTNAKRQPYLRVDHNRGEPQAFQFYDRKQRNITALVLGRLRELQEVPS